MGGSGAAVCYPAARLPSQTTARIQLKVVSAVCLGFGMDAYIPGLVEFFARNSGFGRPSRWRAGRRAISVEMGLN